MTKRQMLLDLVKLINDSDVLPVTAMLDHLAAAPTSASVQQLPGTRLVSPFVGGGGVTELPFAVWIRSGKADTAGRADAASYLLLLADEFESLTMTGGLSSPMDSIMGTDTPSLVERGEDGSEVWRATFVLSFTQ